MVVDDQPVNLRLIEDILKQQGYVVRPFSRGRTALAAAAEQPPDLILLDIDMPEMNGLEVCRKLKADARLACIPVIFLSALSDSGSKVKAFRDGGVDYITKPFQFGEVRARVATQLQMHHLRRMLQKHNEELEETVRCRTQEVEESRLEILRRLATAAEYRDDNTGKHAQRVGRNAALLAQELQMPDYQTRMLRLAAPLHDIGKIGIPDRILLKRRKLSAAEFEVIKTHVVIGAKMLSGSQSPILRMAESIALNHHECWDGTGYSSGLSAERIPLAARIVSVADVFDALIHDRPYKRAWTLEKAIGEIQSQRGRRFDPTVVAAFHKLVTSGRIAIDDSNACQTMEQVEQNACTGALLF
jgi:putative two-component system response regulator